MRAGALRQTIKLLWPYSMQYHTQSTLHLPAVDAIDCNQLYYNIKFIIALTFQTLTLNLYCNMIYIALF